MAACATAFRPAAIGAAAEAGRHRPGGDGQAAAVAAVGACFPGRETQIGLLAEELLRSGTPGLNCLVFGPPSTGKTKVVRGLLQALRLRHAYFNCRENTRPRALLSSLLDQLKSGSPSGGKRSWDDCYECPVKCDGVADFRHQLPGVVGSGGPCWLVLDHADLLAGTDLLAALLRVREDTDAEVSVLLLGAVGWTSGRYVRDTVVSPAPRLVHFPAYRPEQLEKIVQRRWVREQGDGDLVALRQFLQALVPSFCRASNNLLDLEAAVCRLFPLYMRPLREGQQLQALQLYNRVKGEVRQCIEALALRPLLPRAGGAHQQHAAAAAIAAQGAVGDADAASAASGRRSCSRGLAFELSYVSKFLLLASYIASRNKPTTDRAVFDPGYKKRGRRDAQAMDRQAEAAAEAKLRGPHSFPLERLLHIFWVIYAHHDADDEELDEADIAQHQRVMQQAEVLQQVSSMVSMNLLEQCSGDVLEGQLYRCNFGEEMAHALAANVALNLADYLRLA